MQKNAPYANAAIPLSLNSVVGLRYKTINCIECGRPILERNNDRMLRLNNNAPTVAHVGADGTISCVCSNCSQKYTVVITFNMQSSMHNAVPLYMQPQSIFMAIEPVKKLRDVYCMECGKAFYSVSDRVKMVSDNMIPVNMLDPDKLGPMEVWCKFHHCKQRWSVMA